MLVITMENGPYELKFFTSFTECSCTDVLVSSNDLQPEYAGVYLRQTHQLNGRPVFKHETCELYLYYMDDGHGFWIFSPQKGM